MRTLDKILKDVKESYIYEAMFATHATILIKEAFEAGKAHEHENGIYAQRIHPARLAALDDLLVKARAWKRGAVILRTPPAKFQADLIAAIAALSPSPDSPSKIADEMECDDYVPDNRGDWIDRLRALGANQ